MQLRKKSEIPHQMVTVIGPICFSGTLEED
jgi:hypothetical protein